MDQELTATGMWLALVCVNRAAAPEQPGWERMRELQAEDAGAAVALARLAARKGLSARLICSAHGPAARLAACHGIPTLYYDRKISQLWRLWRWQGQPGQLALAAIGAGGLKLADRICRLRRQRPASLSAIFFTNPQIADAKCLRRVSTCLCGSNAIAMALAALKRDASLPTLHVTAPGMDVDAWQRDRAPAPPGRRFIFGMAESLGPQSGALLVVRAMAALWQHPNLPPWEVRMFGAGARGEEILEEAEKLGVLPRLCILGAQTPAEIAKHTDAWLAPGRDPAEAPDAFWGGFAAGLPVLASDTPLHRERSPNPDAALWFNANNPQELASAMLRIMTGAALPPGFAQAGAAMRRWISLEAMAARALPLLLPARTEAAPARET